MLNELTLYCNCFFLHENRHFQANQKNLLCGSFDLPLNGRLVLHRNYFLFDDVKDNISNLNKYFGDLTGLYWVWKNTTDEFVGTNQYRRFYSDNELDSLVLNDNTLYIASPAQFTTSAYQQYIDCSGPMAFDLTVEAIKQKKINMTLEQLNVLHNANFLSPCNMFFAHRKIFDKVCEILFEIIFEIYNGSKYALPYMQYKNQTRLPAFLAERLLNVIYHHKDYYLGNIEIKAVDWYVL
jgi:hypothetical protein